jgi:hypothetical protein
VAYAPGPDEACVDDGLHLLHFRPPEERDHLLLYDKPERLGSDPVGEAAEHRPRIALLLIGDEAEPSDAGVDIEDPGSPLRLLTPFILLIIRALRMPMGLLGSLPGPDVW